MGLPDIYREAADIIERQGYWPGPSPESPSGLPPEDGPRCVVLAINDALNLAWKRPDFVADLYVDPVCEFGEWLGLDLEDEDSYMEMAVQEWSDAQGEGFLVINALRKAAEELAP